jgi:hypothetical protein
VLSKGCASIGEIRCCFGKRPPQADASQCRVAGRRAQRLLRVIRGGANEAAQEDALLHSTIEEIAPLLSGGLSASPLRRLGVPERVATESLSGLFSTQVSQKKLLPLHSQRTPLIRRMFITPRLRLQRRGALGRRGRRREADIRLKAMSSRSCCVSEDLIG